MQKTYAETKEGVTRTRQTVRLDGLDTVCEIMKIIGCRRTNLMGWCRIYREQGSTVLVDQQRGAIMPN